MFLVVEELHFSFSSQWNSKDFFLVVTIHKLKALSKAWILKFQIMIFLCLFALNRKSFPQTLLLFFLGTRYSQTLFSPEPARENFSLQLLYFHFFSFHFSSAHLQGNVWLHQEKAHNYELRTCLVYIALAASLARLHVKRVDFTFPQQTFCPLLQL